MAAPIYNDPAAGCCDDCGSRTYYLGQAKHPDDERLLCRFCRCGADGVCTECEGLLTPAERDAGDALCAGCSNEEAA
jgi:hypothetical protein